MNAAEFQDQIQRDLYDNNERVAFLGEVPSGKLKRGAKVTPFAVTNFGVLTYTSKKNHDRYFWFDATSITLQGSTLTITFGAKEVRYFEGAGSENQSANAAYQIITNLITRVLSRDELKRITFRIDGELDNLPAVDPAKYQPYARLVAKVVCYERQPRKDAKKRREFPHSALARFSEFVNSRSRSFTLTH